MGSRLPILSEWTGMLPYHDIKDIMKIRPFFEEAEDENSLRMLGDVIVDHDVEDEIGVALLHSHFVLEDGEILVEKEDQKEGRVIIAPMSNYERSLPLVPMLWRYENNIGLIPLQWRLESSLVDSSIEKVEKFFVAPSFTDVCSKIPNMARIGFIQRSEFERRIARPMLEKTYLEDRVLVLEAIESTPASSAIRTAIFYRKVNASDRYCDVYYRRSCERGEYLNYPLISPERTTH